MIVLQKTTMNKSEKQTKNNRLIYIELN